MPPKEIISKESIIASSINIIQKSGINELNARRIAKELGCSTKPLFRHYSDMEELKKDVFKHLMEYFNNYMDVGGDKENLLLEYSIKYVYFAKDNPRLFSALFMRENTNQRTIDDVVSAPWNKRFIDSASLENKDNLHAADLFRDLWIYTNGLAAQLIIKHRELTYEEITELITNIYRKLR